VRRKNRDLGHARVRESQKSETGVLLGLALLFLRPLGSVHNANRRDRARCDVQGEKRGILDKGGCFLNGRRVIASGQ